MNVTDVIAATINELIKEQNGEALINRNEFAGRLGCVPSQINYVITSRFTQEQGYVVESKRGGGGYVKIIKLQFDDNDLLMHLINSIDNNLDENFAKIILQNLLDDTIITLAQAKIMLSVISESNFKGLPQDIIRALRSKIFKSMLINCI